MPLVKNPKTRQKIREDLYNNLNSDGVSIKLAVKQLRKILGKSQPEFAEYVGISLSVLRKIEQNTGNVTVETLSKIFDKFSLELVVKNKSK
jgi:DNA-binding transcriptional regulator YiaG